jgi:hypothetical protein
VRAVYRFAPRPDLAMYFRVPIEVSLDRILSGRAKLKYHEAGMDLGMSRDPVESFRMFQSRVLGIYDDIVGEFGLEIVDATGDIHHQQRQVRQLTRKVLKGRGRRPVRPRRPRRRDGVMAASSSRSTAMVCRTSIPARSPATRSRSRRTAWAAPRRSAGDSVAEV